MRGRKRQVVVGTPGLLLAVVVTAASAGGGAAAPPPLGKVTAAAFPRLRLAWADGKYHTHDLTARVAANARYEVEVVRRPAGANGFVVVPRRWVVERTFAWLKRCRRLTAGREESVRSSEAMIRLAMIRLMLHRPRPVGDEAEFRYRKAA